MIVPRDTRHTIGEKGTQNEHSQLDKERVANVSLSLILANDHIPQVGTVTISFSGSWVNSWTTPSAGLTPWWWNALVQRHLWSLALFLGHFCLCPPCENNINVNLGKTLNKRLNWSSSGGESRCLKEKMDFFDESIARSWRSNWESLSKKNEVLKIAFRFKQNRWENNNARDSHRHFHSPLKILVYEGHLGKVPP